MAGLTKKNWLGTLFRVLLFCLGCAVILAISSGFTKGLNQPWPILVPVSISITGAFVLSVLFVHWEKLKLRDIGITPSKRSVSHFLIGIVIGSFLVAFRTTLLLLISGHIKLVRTDGVDYKSILTSIVVYLLLACREEIAFRGYPLQSLNRTIGLWSAQIIVALVFALEHIVGGMHLWQALLGTGIGSIVFGMAAITTKGLAAPIGLHASWNFGQWLLGFKDNTGLWNTIVEKGYIDSTERLGMITYLLVMIMAITVFYYYYHRQHSLIKNSF
jgi:membrane protease YdiL (CAAX protease family)